MMPRGQRRHSRRAARGLWKPKHHALLNGGRASRAPPDRALRPNTQGARRLADRENRTRGAGSRDHDRIAHPGHAFVPRCLDQGRLRAAPESALASSPPPQAPKFRGVPRLTWRVVHLVRDKAALPRPGSHSRPTIAAWVDGSFSAGLDHRGYRRECFNAFSSPAPVAHPRSNRRGRRLARFCAHRAKFSRRAPPNPRSAALAPWK